jgi:hypothetical protein
METPSAHALQLEPTLADLYPVKRVPDRLPPTSRGNRLHPKCPLNWCNKGKHGVFLRYVTHGRQKLTCDRWVFEFLEAVARAQQGAQQPSPARPTPKQHDDARRKRTRRILAGIGLSD